jgi:hypothetical protein
MPTRVAQCDTCDTYLIIRKDGGLGPHVDPDGSPCSGRQPRPSDPSEYTVGFDHHPADISSGAWESNRRKH